MITRIQRVIPAPVGHVWRALTDVDELTAWAGVTPIDIPDGYPAAGQAARWWDRGVILYDVILAVEHERRLASRLQRGSALVLEEYRIRPAGPRATVFQATWRGHPALALNPAYPTLS